MGREDVDKTAMSAATRTLLLGADGPAPALWVGGTSPAALQRAVRFGEGWLSGSQTVAEFRGSLAQLRQFAEQENRPCPQTGIVWVTIPLRVLLQWDDEGNDRQSALELFDAFGSKENTLHANVGGHTGVPQFEVEDGSRFFARHLG
ncbi:MAG TPA: LLM class flavin-dependent oxidoreductase [Acidimicrobiales bacterium]|nr:LLM class flavin-dependent oxidoreductase [Acidimicrobiales bacterium]